MWQQIDEIWTYVPEYFKQEEFFPPDMLFNDETWLLMNPKVLITADRLRYRYGTAFMNTYALSNKVQSVYGINHFRGWRPPYCSVGAKFSQHKWGNAADMVFANVTAESIRADILAKPFDTEFEYITCIEMEVGWLHFDVRPYDKANKGILQIFPQ